MRADIAFLITESSYFLSHRQPLARAAAAAGWTPLLITNIGESDRGKLDFIRLLQLDLRRASHNPVREAVTLWRVFSALRRERPRLLHAVGMKPVLYGTFAARVLGLDTVCALAGLGYLFTSGGLPTRVLRHLVVMWLRLMFRSDRIRIILQNDDDARSLMSAGVIRASQLTLIRGSGVDLNAFSPQPEPDGDVVFTVVSRMLADKGIREVILAARLLRWRGVPCRVRLVGTPDEHNPSSLTIKDLECWKAEGVVEWNGPRSDIARVWAESHVCLLPSYREGLPKALLEAAACGRPIITTDVPGCREVVTDGVEGILVPARDWRPLADAMERLAGDAGLRRRMGQAARARAEAEFGQDRIVAETLGLYSSILGAP